MCSTTPSDDEGNQAIEHQLTVEEGAVEEEPIKDEEVVNENDVKEEPVNPLDEIFPPSSPGEKFRDAVLRLLDGRAFQLIGIIVLFLVIVDGAFFFFLLVGGHGLCNEPSRTDCDPRNWWYNFSVQVLNGLFTWMALVSMPWRCTNWMHIAGWGCPHRNNQVGRDLYGLESDMIWFNIPLRVRGGIVGLLLLNCLSQFANQITRIIFNDFDSQNEFPGNIWTNVFFVLSFLFAAIGAGWLAQEERMVRRAHPPGTFTPGLLQVIEPHLPACCKKLRTDAELAAMHFEHYDPTRHASLHDIISVSRPEFRLFGL
jgi:hypothetical protein